MCVFSQEAAVTRDARAGEPLKVKQFKHAVGFCPVGETTIAACVRPGSTIEFDQPIRYKRSFLMGLRWRVVETDHTTAKLICINEFDPRLKSISDKDLAHYCHDWLELPDGTLVCLSRLVVGQIARVHDPVKKLLDEANATINALPEGALDIEPCGFFPHEGSVDIVVAGHLSHANGDLERT